MEVRGGGCQELSANLYKDAPWCLVSCPVRFPGTEKCHKVPWWCSVCVGDALSRSSLHHKGLKGGLGSQADLDSNHGCVTRGKLLNISDPVSSHVKRDHANPAGLL